MIGQTPPSAEAAPGTLKPETADAVREAVPPKEVGGREGPEPTRYGDWEKNGRCIDF
ncbi:hypothetical protein CSC71_08155 [Pseudoxanthomonas sangjuensis]|uniref:DUF1674 domain-containing protein n=1 Tax=Pseudoxanthomonas sangjuensis TaxID=1503750 RepID=UPI001390732E|nr:DUF1674 domain-containing protein [Pseudoxanthomonas sangjuensis]KAF1713290.1 hypothetical protein CSC71_08155 [Pseudoxanthomonas sangjuensis]